MLRDGYAGRTGCHGSRDSRRKDQTKTCEPLGCMRSISEYVSDDTGGGKVNVERRGKGGGFELGGGGLDVGGESRGKSGGGM